MGFFIILIILISLFSILVYIFKLKKYFYLFNLIPTFILIIMLGISLDLNSDLKINSFKEKYYIYSNIEDFNNIDFDIQYKLILEISKINNKIKSSNKYYNNFWFGVWTPEEYKNYKPIKLIIYQNKF